MFNVGDYTFAPYKVVWRYIATEFTSAVVEPQPTRLLEPKTVIPDCKLMLVATRTREEAFYLCGILNSGPSRFLVQSFMIGTQIAPHVLTRLRLQVYDTSNATHRELAALSRAAHAAVAEGQDVGEIEAEIDRQAARLWGLTGEELREIQESLAELG